MTAHASNPINIREPHPVGTSFLFRALRDDECELGYSFIAGASAWLSGKGIRMWERPLPLSTYLQRQQRGENYGLFVDDRLTAIASIIDIPVDWQQDIDDIRAKWLSTLAVSPSDHGNGIGREAIVQISIMLAARDCRDLYLDCSPGFLLDYYHRLGFECVTSRRRIINRPPAPDYEAECVLMRRRLGADDDE